MPSRVLPYPLFDADNHLYETREALTKFLPDGVQGRDRLRRGPKAAPRSSSGARSASTSPTRPSTSWPGPARRRTTSARATPRARAAARSSASRCASIPAFREPAPRLELMDEQGIDRTLMFPTLASLVEERMRDDPDLIHAVIHALNEWMHETWTFDYEDRIFATPVITLPIVDKAIEELEWVRRARRPGRPHPAGAGARLPRPAVVRACRSSTRSGRRSSSTTSSSPCTPPTAATSATPTSGWAPAARCCRSSRRPSGCLGSGGRSRTRWPRWSATARCRASPSSRSR